MTWHLRHAVLAGLVLIAIACGQSAASEPERLAVQFARAAVGGDYGTVYDDLAPNCRPLPSQQWVAQRAAYYGRPSAPSEARFEVESARSQGALVRVYLRETRMVGTLPVVSQYEVDARRFDGRWLVTGAHSPTTDPQESCWS
jgi:hypothetical protein